MLTHVVIQNFRSLREIDVPLRPLTVLIGANDTGKSSFLSAVREAINGNLAGYRDDCWLGDPTSPPAIRLTNDLGKQLDFSCNYVGNGEFHVFIGGDEDIEIRPCVKYSLPVQGAEMLSNGYPDGAGVQQLDADGGGVPSLLDYLLRRQRKRFDSIVEALRSYIPGLEDIEISTPEPSVRRLDLVLANGLKIRADQASAGVRLLIFFIALAYHPSPPRLILLEEPENGVHPKRLGEIVSLLKDITAGIHGEQPAQVILTTHSPYLLDSINPEVDQVLVFRRNQDGSRSAEPVDTDRLKVFLDEFMLGEVWYSQGEEGLVARRS